jgi:hypothetical protein
VLLEGYEGEEQCGAAGPTEMPVLDSTVSFRIIHILGRYMLHRRADLYITLYSQSTDENSGVWQLKTLSLQMHCKVQALFCSATVVESTVTMVGFL